MPRVPPDMDSVGETAWCRSDDGGHGADPHDPGGSPCLSWCFWSFFGYPLAGCLSHCYLCYISWRRSAACPLFFGFGPFSLLKLLSLLCITYGCCLLVGFINLKPDASCVFVLKKHVRMLLEKLVKLCETKSAKKIDDYMCNANFC